MLRKTLNSEIMKNSSGRVRVAKKKFGSGRVAGTRQTLFVTPTSDIAESLSPIFIVLIFNLLKVGHPCSFVDDPNARDNLMQVYGCQSGIDKFVSQKIDI